MTFKEITKYLNDDNYRTRDGLPYTEIQVLEIWNMRETKFKMEYINYQKYMPSPPEVIAKQAILNVPNVTEKPKHEILQEPPYHLIEEAYNKALIEAAIELNSKLELNPPIDTTVTVPKLVNALIKVLIKNLIHPKGLTDKTLNVLGGLLYHPDFL